MFEIQNNVEKMQSVTTLFLHSLAAFLFTLSSVCLVSPDQRALCTSPTSLSLSLSLSLTISLFLSLSLSPSLPISLSLSLSLSLSVSLSLSLSFFGGGEGGVGFLSEVYDGGKSPD
jgi:hypothetical protein